MNIFSPSLINSIFSFLSLLSWIVLLIITAKFIDKKEENKRIKASLAKLEGAFKDLDEQARLIVKTDLELNKTQEELDKKISGLYTLHKLSRAMSTTLIEEEILQRIEDSLILELGFERCLVLFLKDSQLISKLNVGYSDKELQNVQSQFANVLEDRHLESLLFEKSLCASSVKLETDKQLLNRVSSCLGLASFIICPIKTQEEFLGIIIMGNTSSVFSITEGDEDLVAILANQIGQAIENARLFEQTWRSQQDLEKKVKERTKELTQA
ncbi:MAG: GAF domain-containing protein, partial [Candidatus Desantisbacteria bacterium]